MQKTNFIYQQYQNNPKSNSLSSSLSLPMKNRKSTKQSDSYVTVLEQLLVTDDKNMIRDIFINASTTAMTNTVAGLAFGKTTSIMKVLQLALLEDCEHTIEYIRWIECMLSTHLGIIISTPETQSIIIRIKKYITKRSNNFTNLVKLQQQLPKDYPITLKDISDNAKFHYIREDIIDSDRQKQQNDDDVV